jgi:4'-phosphopantetheinyl transferase EntD
MIRCCIRTRTMRAELLGKIAGEHENRLFAQNNMRFRRAKLQAYSCGSLAFSSTEENLYKAFSCDQNRFMVHLFYTIIEHTDEIQQTTGCYDRLEG